MENITWLRDVIYVIPVAILIWKAATQSAQIKRNTDDIKSIKSVVEKQNDEIIKMLNRMNESIQAVRCEVEIIKALRKMELEGKKNDTQENQ